MNIESEKPKTIFKYKTKDGKEFYSLGLSKKKQDGSFENGFISCRFKKDVQLENKTKIQIKSAWLDFYVKERITNPYIFINEFEIVEQEEKAEPKEEVNEFSTLHATTENQDTIQLDDSDLPF